MKIINIRVSSCEECPYMREYPSGIHCEEVRNFNGQLMMIKTYSQRWKETEMPEWCPLEDDNDLY